MPTELRRFTRLLRPDELPEALANPGMFESVSLEIIVDLDGVRAIVDDLIATTPKGSPREVFAAWDAAMVQPLHVAFDGVPRRLLSDMRLWQWLCIRVYPEFVLARWCSPEAAEAFDDLSAAERGRFLGKPSLNGVSRNALARLFWCGEALSSADDGYDLPRAALYRQDFFQAVFERKFGLYRPAARACVVKLGDATELVWRDSLKRLNFCLSTMVVEAMDESVVGALLEEFAT